MKSGRVTRGLGWNSFNPFTSLLSYHHQIDQRNRVQRNVPKHHQTDQVNYNHRNRQRYDSARPWVQSKQKHSNHKNGSAGNRQLPNCLVHYGQILLVEYVEEAEILCWNWTTTRKSRVHTRTSVWTLTLHSCGGVLMTFPSCLIFPPLWTQN